MEKNQLLIGAGGGIPGSVRVVIQNCCRVEVTCGAVLTDSLIESDCLLWPNPVSGVRTRAVFANLGATAGDDITLSLESDSFNTLLLVFGPDGSPLATVDDAVPAATPW